MNSSVDSIPQDTIKRIKSDVALREPCIRCANESGYVVERNGQFTVRCENCNAFLYNLPKHELGLTPKPARSGPVKPSVRYVVEERAGFRCEFCGADSKTRQMHVGHLLSEKNIRESGLPLVWADHPDNLAWICEACNLGMGARSFTIHHALLWAIKRQLEG